jgi:hypothetical protein
MDPSGHDLGKRERAFCILGFYTEYVLATSAEQFQ